MGKKKLPKMEDDDEIVEVIGGENDGLWKEFGDSLEHLRNGKAIIVVTLDRATGNVEVDDKLSTPAETWYALDRAATEKCEALEGVEPEA